MQRLHISPEIKKVEKIITTVNVLKGSNSIVQLDNIRLIHHTTYHVRHKIWYCNPGNPHILYTCPPNIENLVNYLLDPVQWI